MLPAFGHRLLFPIFLITLFMSISRGVSVWSWHSENLATVFGVGGGVDLVGVMEENKVQGCVCSHLNKKVVAIVAQILGYLKFGHINIPKSIEA